MAADMRLISCCYQGEHHRKQRKLLNPVFSLGHLRDVVPTFYHVSYKVCAFARVSVLPTSTSPIQLRDAIASKLKGCPQDIDLLHWTSRAALELIGQSVCQKKKIPMYLADLFGLRWPWYCFAYFVGVIYSLAASSGYSFDSFDESTTDGPVNEYRAALKDLMFVYIAHIRQQSSHASLMSQGQLCSGCLQHAG
jgi:cytochrome P450